MSVTTTRQSTGATEGGEVPRLFVPVPERVSQFLELKAEEIEHQMATQKGRTQLFNDLMEHQDLLKEEYPGFNPEHLRLQLEDIGSALSAKKAFTKDMEPKKGLLRRMLSGAGDFVKKNPLKALLIVLAAAAGGVGISAYTAGGMESLLAGVGLEHLYGAEGAAASAESLGKLMESGKDLLPDLYDTPVGPLQE